MDIIQLLLKEMDQEAQTTRKMLERVPDDRWDWKPHEKSMDIKRLTVHIAELPSWVTMGLNTDGIDFAATPYQPTTVNNKGELLQLFEQ
ncbi:MAG: DinB family protein, partial [Flavisolibacter sp.]|nr:DinB family protein [Flavisolibacter sp.]